MKHLIIKNIGPVVSADIDMKRVNLIIGPQSSGKSSIIKIACYCTWVEKRIALEQSCERFSVKGFFEKRLVSFHKLEGFIQEDSFIMYESDIMKFSFSKKNEAFDFEWKKRWEYRKSKISYIPAERNIVAAIPNWFEVNLEDNNIRNFMADWEVARKDFTTGHELDILNLGVKYFYESNGKVDKVQIASDKALNFTNTSSGLQSLIPLYTLLKYLTDGFYRDENLRDSIADDTMNKILLQTIYRTLFEENQKQSDVTYLGSDPIKGEVILQNINGTILPFTTYKDRDDCVRIYQNFTEVNHTTIFLEEPEENLFPLTQRDLVNSLVDMISGEYYHNLFITTHSPYIMASFNNLIQAGDVLAGDIAKRELLNAILPSKLALNFNEVSAYALKNGEVHFIMDEEMQLISPSELDSVSDEISVQFGKLLDL